MKNVYLTTMPIIVGKKEVLVLSSNLCFVVLKKRNFFSHIQRTYKSRACAAGKSYAHVQKQVSSTMLRSLHGSVYGTTSFHLKNHVNIGQKMRYACYKRKMNLKYHAHYFETKMGPSLGKLLFSIIIFLKKKKTIEKSSNKQIGRECTQADKQTQTRTKIFSTL